MAVEKRSIWSRIKNYATKHPVKAFFIGAAIVVGVAAFVVGTVLTAGALAGAGAAAVGVGTVATGVTASAFAGAAGTAAYAGIALAGLATVVVGARFVAKEITHGNLASATKFARVIDKHASEPPRNPAANLSKPATPWQRAEVSSELKSKILSAPTSPSTPAASWKSAKVSNAARGEIMLEERIGQIQKNSTASSSAQQIEMQKAVNMLTKAKNILADVTKIEKNVSQFRDIKTDLVGVLTLDDTAPAAVAQQLVEKLRVYQEGIFKRIQQPVVRTETHMSVIDATGERENVNRLIKNINDFVAQLERDYQIDSPAKPDPIFVSLDAARIIGSTARVTAAIQDELPKPSVNPTKTASQTIVTEESAKPSVARYVAAKVLPPVSTKPIVAEKKSVLESGDPINPINKGSTRRP